jgi:hypothetical protein
MIAQQSLFIATFLMAIINISVGRTRWLYRERLLLESLILFIISIDLLCEDKYNYRIYARLCVDNYWC